MKLKKANISTFKSDLNNQSWYFFNWEVSIIVGISLFIAFFNYLPALIGNQEEATIFFKNGDKYVPNSLRDNIVYSSFSISITIIGAIFIGIYTEMGKFAGRYSSAIFALVPSLVWLFSSRNSNHISDLIETQSILEQTIFWSSISIFLIFVLASLFFHFMYNMNFLKYSKLRLALANNIINRIIIVLVNINILFALSYTLVNFGLFTLDLGNASLSEQRSFFERTGLELGHYNLQSENFITYIAVIAIVFALIVILINLTHTFTQKNSEPADKDEDTSFYIEKTIKKNLGDENG